jgi:hypothetical protein
MSSSIHDDEAAAENIMLDAHPTMRSAKLLDRSGQPRHSKSAHDHFPDAPYVKFPLHFTSKDHSPLEKSGLQFASDDNRKDHKTVWEVNQLPATSFPQFLERSHRRIDGIAPSNIAHSIASWMQENSITVEFDHIKVCC